VSGLPDGTFSCPKSRFGRDLERKILPF
jgi:hypothetical protein